MRQFKITIPEPCTEKWQEMSPTEKGANCEKCSKEVIDFTQVSQMELSRRLASVDALCGRFRRDQLDRPLPVLSRNSWKQKVAALGFSVLLSASCSKESIVPNPGIETQQAALSAKPLYIEVGIPEATTNTMIISGTITDGEMPLPGASVVLKGTQLGVQADLEGFFELEIPPEQAQNATELIVTYIGFEAYYHKIEEGVDELNIVLEQELTILGEVIIVASKQ
ncbi:carboxypeptidase-like regulatory domain-containing protein [Robiginitalea sp. IMCC43444]|uniref:carboxypeptidase-like regulatory domain-containing protein n=1 Tax=Robiginitalea sp. IMCC43444 TaxID=3459121 RepID=UPI00404121F0